MKASWPWRVWMSQITTEPSIIPPTSAGLLARPEYWWKSSHWCKQVTSLTSPLQKKTSELSSESPFKSGKLTTFTKASRAS
eukprot:CAMPEP_0115199308 /NCGR_PEP_ID=MMETSP0270-20121206/16552_1 /TAXON_ID=71861 /ORGANISM="Scrippsiella trochoidea, Strain CCMP3099" /LENGTH=80 /DNA_ID=CAMNT_0002612703 /DNA_START=301 /DNA_END=543 /DNA_ORIENTATION=+